MKIKNSLTISLIGMAAILIVALVYFGYIFWLQGNLEHENGENREKITRIQAAFDQEQQVLVTLCNDWGFWDEAYKFVGSNNLEFLQQYGQSKSLTWVKLGVDYMAIFDSKGKKMLSLASGQENDRSFAEQQKSVADFGASGALHTAVTNSKEGIFQGVVNYDNKLVLAAIALVLPGNGEGEPKGYLLFGKKIDAGFLATVLSKSAVKDVQLEFSASGPSWLKNEQIHHDRTFNYYSAPDAGNQSGYFVIWTQENKPLFISAVVQAKTDGYETMRQFMLFVLLFLFLAILLFLLIARKVLFSKFVKIEKYLQNYDASKVGGNKERLAIGSNDELSDLANALNQTIDEVEALHQNLIDEYEERKTSDRKLLSSQAGTIVSLAKLAEYRDKDTGDHLIRVAATCKTIATKARQRPEFAGLIDETFINTLEISATMHDIGKVGISDAVLRKKGIYTIDEYEIMKTHTILGSITLQEMAGSYPDNDFIKMSRIVARYHHERWNGSGYPEQLSKTDIPLPARIVALADVFDALVSERCYKQAYSLEKSRRIIVDSSGIQFDPTLVEIFCECFEDICQQYQMCLIGADK